MIETDSEKYRKFYEVEYTRDVSLATIPDNDDFMYAQVLRQLNPYLSEGLKVLDLGCNNGNLSLYMASKGCNVLGIDIAKNAIESARRSADYNRIYNVRFESMDFLLEWDKQNFFDFVLCSHVIEHIPRDDQFLNKISLSLRPKGKLLLFTPVTYSSLASMSKILTGHFKHDEEVGHIRRYTKKSIRDVIESSGFEIHKMVFLDSILRDWFILFKPLRKFNTVWGLPYIRNIFNNIDGALAECFFFPACICVHAQRIHNEK
jgi:2-polyprenyl-3-methyl-5-hydroxy-6-metoxy-1,4-benzoquinol methylase